MDKTFLPSCSSSRITYVEEEAVEFSRFRFRFHIPDCNQANSDIELKKLCDKFAKKIVS